MKAKEFMRQLEKLNRMIENKLIERDQLISIATSSTSQMGGERVKSSGSYQKMADAVNKFVDIEREINRNINRLNDTKAEILNVIEQLRTFEYDVLHKIYVQGFTFYDVADAYNKSYSWATTMHGNALKSVQQILDEREGDKNECSI